MTALSRLQQNARLAATIGQIGKHVLWERVSNARPSRPPGVPASTESLTTDWLTAVLCRNHPGARVTSVQTWDCELGFFRSPRVFGHLQRGRPAGEPSDASVQQVLEGVSHAAADGPVRHAR